MTNEASGPAVAGKWTGTAPMGADQTDHTATLLANGDVLVACEWDHKVHDFVAQTLIYRSAKDVWTRAGVMITARRLHSAVRIPNGDVLVAGGIGQRGYFLGSAERFDASSEMWRAAGNLVTEETMDPSLTLLNDGRVLALAPGLGSADYGLHAEVYDPAQNAWTKIGLIAGPRRTVHSAILLRNGKVLIVGGYDYVPDVKNPKNSPVKTCALLDPLTGTATDAAPTHTDKNGIGGFRCNPGLVLLADGHVLAVSQKDGSTEIYDPDEDRWMVLSPNPKHFLQSSPPVMLSDGRILVAGGIPPGDFARPVKTCMLFDPRTGAWSSGPDLIMAHFGCTTTILATGQALTVSGGIAELFTLGV